MNIYEQLDRYLRIDSTSGHEAAFLEELEVFLREQGFDCLRQPVAHGRWNLLATHEQPPRLLYSTHVDTVPPFLPPRREGDVVYGRGACDTKGGIVAMLRAGVRLLAEGRRDFGYLFVVGEEVDHIGAKFAADGLDLQVERIVLCEPTNNRVVSAQKGMLKFALEARGVAGHSAFPDRGVSAIHGLLGALEALRHEPWPHDALLGPTTFNVGVIEGGVAANVFAPSARAELIFRTVSPTAPLLERVERLIAPHGVELTTPIHNDPVVFDPPRGVETCVVPFNTDASYLRALGPVWLVGPGEIEHAHSEHEHITLSGLEAGIELYVALAHLV